MRKIYNLLQWLKFAGNSGRIALVVGAAILLSGSRVQGQGVSFSQWANEDVQWIPGALIPNNSQYYEATSTLQRAVFVGIPAKPNDNHELVFKVLAKKGNVYAYDFVTGFDQAIQDYVNVTGSTTALLNGMTKAQLVGSLNIPNPATQSMILGLYGGGNKAIATVPASQYNQSPKGDVNVFNVVTFYDGATYPKSPDVTANSLKRGIELYGNAPIFNAALEFTGFTKGGSDTYGNYKLTYKSTSTNLLVLMGGHLSVGATTNSPYNSLAYGSGFGASSISGGPYHFKLEKFDNASLGNQDNQIQSGAIEVFQGQCSLQNNSTACEGDILTYTVTTNGSTRTWAITGDGEFVDSATEPASPTTPTGDPLTVYVRATAPTALSGYFKVTVTTSGSGVTTKVCEDSVVVNAIPDKPSVVITEAKLCGGPAYPSVQICSPLAGLTYYLRQPATQNQSAINYPSVLAEEVGGIVEVSFDSLVAGRGFEVWASNNGCLSDTTECGDAEILEECPATPTARKASAIVNPAKASDKPKELTAFPVPFYEKATVKFRATRSEQYVINLYDLHGNLVKQLKEGNARAGEEILVDVPGKGLVESIYLVRKVSRSGISTVKILKKN